jgi:hypothetical protein
MSAPLRKQELDEMDPLSAAERGRAEAEAAVADLMVAEKQRAVARRQKTRAHRRSRLELPHLVLAVLVLTLAYFVQVKPAWMILPIPVTTSAYQYYGESWRAAIDLRQQQVQEARMRRQRLTILQVPSVVPHVHARHRDFGYIRRGDSYRTCLLKSFAFTAWMMQLGGR